MKNTRAMEICANWHGGQWSALYQFASSGTYLVENHLRYLKELQENREPEFYLIPGTISKKNDSNLKGCIAYFEKQGRINGIDTVWEKHPVYGYFIPFLKEDNSRVKPLGLLI